MKKAIIKLFIFFTGSVLIWYACEKEPEPPVGKTNKISFFDEPISDTVSYRSVSIACNIKDIGNKEITQHGFCWDTAGNPDITKDTLLLGSLAEKGMISGALTGLSPGTNYYVRGFIQFGGITVYTTQDTISTLALTAPSLVTTKATGITDSTAITGGEIKHNGGAEVTEKGICYAEHTAPTLTDLVLKDTTSKEQFSIQLTGLKYKTTYYVRAYAINSVDTAYGNEISFTTSITLPIITTDTANNITHNTANVQGNVLTNGGAEVTARGICYNTSQNPTVSDNKTTNGTGTGIFSGSLSGLSPNTTYYVRAYATNGAGTSYGRERSFTTAITIPTVTTNAVSAITANSAQTGGNVTANGGVPVTSRGVCYSTSQNPTTSDNKTTDGSGTGSFTSNLSGLSLNTTYYVRAYATNSEGTAYGAEKTFTTDDGVIELTTSGITNITATSATSGGNITDDGGLPVTARGVCWSTSSNPTTSDNKTTNGSGTGSFTSELTGLTEGTTYYVRAYATNDADTAYGAQENLTTFALAADDVFNPATGKIWKDKNLGASRVAQSSTDDEAYGDLYQWGRAADGHEKRTSNTSSTLSSTDDPGHSDFITVGSSPRDWRSPQNDNLWQDLSGTNNPCPSGYRLPTEAEWEAERQSWSSNDAAGAFASPLKLPVSGYRSSSDGSLGAGSNGHYWSSTVDGTYSRELYFDSSSDFIQSYNRAGGSSVRCIKD